MDARYYDPLIGRFYSNDPIGYNNVHNFNRYAYGNNNPYRFIYPTGESSIEAFSQKAKAVWTSIGNKISSSESGAAKQSTQLPGAVGDAVASKPVQALSDKLGKLPLAPAQAISTALNVANLVLNGDVSGVAGDAAGGATEKGLSSKLGSSPKAKIITYVASQFASTVTSTVVKEVQENVTKVEVEENK